MIGTTLSHYKVLEKIGQGGMGEVYRAEDTNLSREVAIKVLPEQFTQDPQRLARFEREAKLLASLNHPNIAAIYGFEHSDDMHFLVLELVPGETLAERVAKGPVPVEEALEVCRQIAEGVEAAHEKGVIHRDLKPANVKVTPEGQVKILDFGLAKAFEGETPVTDISQSPTLTEEMTRAGVILGTAAYMSPEQAKGKPVDKRSDVFAFGAVLYELLTGKRAFEGETITETIAAVLKSEPEWARLPENTPWGIRTLLRRCLQKETNRRLQHVGDVRIEIEEAISTPLAQPSLSMARTTEGRTTLKWALQWAGVGMVVGAVLLGMVVWFSLLAPQTTPTITRLALNLPETAPLYVGGTQFWGAVPMALSPGGERLGYVGGGENGNRLYIREMDQLVTRDLLGTENAVSPFFSPDGQWVGFAADGKLKKVSVEGGSPITLCDIEISDLAASWSQQGTIVFGGMPSGLCQVPSTGGLPEPLTSPDTDEWSHTWPQVLPDGKGVLFTSLTSPTQFSLRLYSFETGTYKVVIENGQFGRYLPTGQIVYRHLVELYSVPFNLDSLEVTGSPVQISEDVRLTADLSMYYALSDSGTLVYAPSTAGQAGNGLIWIDREGNTSPLLGGRNYDFPRISPDGQRLVVRITEGTHWNVWLYDIARDTLTQFTSEGDNDLPIWTPDGEWITFTSTRKGGPWDVFHRRSDGSGEAKQLTTSEVWGLPSSWSPDGKILAFWGIYPETLNDIWLLDLQSEEGPQPFVAASANEQEPRFSPDGRWIAYDSDESGERQVYVRAYPGLGGRIQISNEAGYDPLWSPDQRELFYRNARDIMVVEIQTNPDFQASKPRLLFKGPELDEGLSNYRSWDIMPDGQRFIAVERPPAPTQLVVVLNWFEELKRLVPTE